MNLLILKHPPTCPSLSQSVPTCQQSWPDPVFCRPRGQSWLRLTSATTDWEDSLFFSHLPQRLETSACFSYLHRLNLIPLHFHSMRENRFQLYFSKRLLSEQFPPRTDFLISVFLIEIEKKLAASFLAGTSIQKIDSRKLDWGHSSWRKTRQVYEETDPINFKTHLSVSIFFIFRSNQCSVLLNIFHQILIVGFFRWSQNC